MRLTFYTIIPLRWKPCEPVGWAKKGSAVPIGRGINRFSRGNGLASRDVLMGLNEVGQRSNDGHASFCPSYGAAALPPVEVLSTPPIVCSFYTIIPLRWKPCEPVGWAKVVPCPSGAGTTDSAGATVRHRAMC